MPDANRNHSPASPDAAATSRDTGSASGGGTNNYSCPVSHRECLNRLCPHEETCPSAVCLGNDRPIESRDFHLALLSKRVAELASRLEGEALNTHRMAFAARGAIRQAKTWRAKYLKAREGITESDYAVHSLRWHADGQARQIRELKAENRGIIQALCECRETIERILDGPHEAGCGDSRGVCDCARRLLCDEGECPTCANVGKVEQRCENCAAWTSARCCPECDNSGLKAAPCPECTQERG